MTPELFKLHKTMFLELKERALSYEGQASKELKQYRKELEGLSVRPVRKTNIETLIKRVQNAHIVYLGDFHSFDQNGKNLIRILEHFFNKKSKICIGIEAIYAEDQGLIEAYLEGHLTELEFLELTHYHDSWKFPWIHYKVFFEFAKKNHVEIMGLNSKGQLSQRDSFAANILSSKIQENPQCIFLVLFGELHIMPQKLPKKVLENLGSMDVHQVIIHQNLDPLYFKGRKNFLEEQIFRFNENEFCLQTSPPWVKYESLIYWYEHLLNDPDFDIHEYILESALKKIGPDISENFFDLSQIISHALGFTPHQGLNDFNLYDHTSLNYILKIVSSLPSKSVQKKLRQLVAKGELFCLPMHQSYYCPNYSLNRLAFLAGVHTCIHFSQDFFDSLNMLLLSRSKKDNFLYFMYIHLLGHIGSKIINPYKKCDLYLDFKRKSESGEKVAQIVLSLIHGNHPLSLNLKDLNFFENYLVAKKIGTFMAEIFFEFILVNKQAPTFFKDFILQKHIHEGSFFQMLSEISRRVDIYQTKKRLF